MGFLSTWSLRCTLNVRVIAAKCAVAFAARRCLFLSILAIGLSRDQKESDHFGGRRSQTQKGVSEKTPKCLVQKCRIAWRMTPVAKGHEEAMMPSTETHQNMDPTSEQVGWKEQSIGL